MRAAAMMIVLAVGASDGGALSVVQAHCSSDTKQSAYKVAAAFACGEGEAEASRWTTGRAGEEQCSVIERRRKRSGVRKTGEARESQWVSEGGYCLHRANQNQPFQHTLPLGPFTDQHTRVVEAYAQVAHMYAYARVRVIPSK